MPFTIGKCKLFRIKHTTLLEGETFLRNKHKIAFFEISANFLVEKKTSLESHAMVLIGLSSSASTVFAIFALEQ